MIQKENQNEQIVFLFGAGISIPIGIPAMRGIYKSFMNKRLSGISEKDKKICKMFIDEMGVEEDLEEFLLAANSILEFQGSPIIKFVEKGISKVKNTKNIIAFNERLNSTIIDVESVKEAIVDFLAKKCFTFNRDKTVQINKAFVKVVSKLGYPIYTTNYDYAFEHVTMEEDIPLHDNFKKKGQRYVWNEDIDFPTTEGLRLIKLHGSVIWYSDNTGTIEKIYSKTNINSVGKEVRRTVITPTKFKDIYEQHFFALYSHFIGSLAKAKVIIIAGHSLRDDYLRAAIIERKRKGDFKVIVIDPNYPIEIKNELPAVRVGTKGEVNHIPYKWEEFSDELAHILLNSSHDNLIDDFISIINKRKFAKTKVKIKGNVGSLITLQKKTLTVEVDAYLASNERPSKLRVWLEGTYPDASGKQQNKVSHVFLEGQEINLANGLTGLVKITEKITFKVPKYEVWQQAKIKVSLKVGIIKGTVSKPANISTRNVFAVDSKMLPYK